MTTDVPDRAGILSRQLDYWLLVIIIINLVKYILFLKKNNLGYININILAF